MPRSRSSRRSPGEHLTSIFSRLARAVRGLASDLVRADRGRSQQSAYLFERLEERLQFVILGPADGVMEILDAKLNTIRIAWHDITVELFGVGVGTPDPTSPYPPDVSTLEQFVPGTALLDMPPPTIGVNVFTIYVLNSRPDSWFEAALVPPVTVTTTRSEEPFTGSAGPFSIDAANGTGTITFSPPGDSGIALLGAVHTAVGDATQPIFTVPDGNNNAIGPRSPLFESGGEITAGLYMSPIALEQNPADPINPTDYIPVTRVVNGVTYDTPNDIGYFHWAGTMFGNVIIQSPAAAGDSVAPPSQDNSGDPVLNSQGGNIGEFYAGCLLEGNANGNPTPLLGTDISDQTPNFVIDGDIRDLVTSGPIGGDPLTAANITGSLYITGFDGFIQGTVGQIYLREGNFIGSLDVAHDPSVYGLPDNIFSEPELEVKPNGPANGDGGVGPIFRGIGTIGGVSIGFPALPTPFNNDSASTITNNPNAIGTPQYLGSILETDSKTGLPLRDADGNLVYAAEVSGVIQGEAPANDRADNYAVPLLAGQTITIEADTTQTFQVQVIDPDGRIVASDLNNRNEAQTLDQPFQYTADRPGEYTLDVTNLPGVVEVGDVAYTLEVQGVGDMALGTISIPGGSWWDTGITNALTIGNGDLGAIVAGVGIASSVENLEESLTPPEPSIAVANGNLRALKGSSIGILTASTTDTTTGEIIAATFGAIPTIGVPDGAVGLVQGFSGTGICAVQTLFDLNNLNDLQTQLTPTVPFQAVGGDFQRIDGAGLVWLDIATNQGIGVINAGSMATVEPSFLDVNADNVGNDGIIDLIDVTGDLGVDGDGGPGIVTHDGGYVRYMRVGGDIFQDSFFGSGFPTNTTYDPGQTVSYTDDTGATLTFAPLGQIFTFPVINPLNASQTINETFGPQVNLTTYGIRDKGGGVIVDASVTSNFTLNQTVTTAAGTTVTLSGLPEGLNITAAANGASNNEADISSIGIEGEATQTIGLATDPTTGAAEVDANGEQTYGLTPLATTTGTTTTTTVNTLGLTINGSAAVDVLDVVAFQLGTVVPADVTEIENNTAGEIDGVSAASIGTLYSHGTIGLPRHTTPMAIVPSEILSNATGDTWDQALNEPIFGGPTVGNIFPWDQQATGIVTSGNVENIIADQGLGNILVVGGIGTVTAEASGKGAPGVFSGIDGPVIALFTTTIPDSGRVLQVNIGQGILSAGTGNAGLAGIYAQADIGTVTNNGKAQADIRGNIVSEATIDNINLVNGSLINAEVISITSPTATPIAQSDFSQSGVTGGGGFVSSTLTVTSSATTPTFNIRQVTVGGNGGILSSIFGGSNVGPISVGSKGFGIFFSDFVTVGNGVLGTISAGGYGVRDSVLEGGAILQGLNATGNGSQVPVTNFGTDVRPSDLSSNDGFDPFSGAIVNQLDDLNADLGTSARTPLIESATDTGVLEDDEARASNSMGAVNAQTIRSASPVFQPITLPLEPAPTIPVVGQIYAMELAIASTISKVNVRGVIDGLEITTGHLGSFTPHGSVSRLGISVAGTIDSLVIHGNLGQMINDPLTNDLIPDSYIMATGLEGSIKSLTVAGDLNANINAFQTIGRMTVNGSVNGSITAQGQTPTLTLGYLRVLGDIRDGSITIDGNAGTIITNGSLGNPTGSLTIGGNLGSLSVGASHQKNSSLELPLHVEGSVGSLTVYGRIDGAVTIDDDIKTLKVTNDGTQANIINGNITIGGLLGNAQIINGNIAANITANNTISSFTLARGSVLFGSTIQSQINTITNFRITGGLAYGMFGSLLAPSGQNGSFDISGNVGDGTDAASIVAATGNKFRVRGSIVNAATIAVTGQLNYLEVDHNIETGALVSAHPLKKLKVGGTNTGTVITV